MQLSGRWIVIPAALALLLMVAQLGTSATTATRATGAALPTAKVSASLRQVVDSSAPEAKLPVMVFGSDLDAANAATGVDVRLPLAQFGGEAATVRADAVAALSAQPGVAYVTTDSKMVSTEVAPPSPTTLATTYPLVDRADAAWARNLTGTGVATAVIDSGVSKLADLGSRVVQVALPGQDPASLDDGYGHGTFVAGVEAGRSADGRHVGIAPGSTVYALNVSRPDGVRSSDVIAGLFWVLQNSKAKHITAVNLSLSENTASSYKTNPLDSVVELLWKNGITVVASAGNGGPGTTSFAPGNDPFAITVGALDTADTLDGSDDTVASFSSRGATSDGVAKPELLAPGRHVVAPIPAGSVLDGQAPAANHVEPGYVMMNGTSFSAPQVTAAVAILHQAHPAWTPDQLKWVLVRTARNVPNAGPALDLGAALDYAGTPSAANTGIDSAWSFTATGAAPSKLPPDTCGSANACAKAAAYEAAAKVFEDAATWDKAAAQWELAIDMWNAGNSPLHADMAREHAANAYQQLALQTGSSLAWRKAGQKWTLTGATWDQAATWDRAAAAWDAAAAAYEKAATWDLASTAWASSATDWERAATWDHAATWDRAAAAWDHSADDAVKLADYDRAAAAWDVGGADWSRAAAWDAAAWDKAADDWTKAATWDTAATWDQAAAWDAAAAWDGATWDGATWDAAAWDSKDTTH
jgi:serine protease AprX